MFAGRLEEQLTLEKILHQTKLGNPQHFLIDGERGIGKTSLLYYLQSVAEGKIATPENLRYNFVVLNLALEPTTSYDDIVRKVGTELRRVVAERCIPEEYLKTAWDFLKRWEVAGVKYNRSSTEVPAVELLNELAGSIEGTLRKLSSIDGILVLIDEADNPPTSAGLGRFVKLLTERLGSIGCEKTAVGLAGQTGVVRKLAKSHPSAPRLLQILTLDPLSVDERRSVITLGLKAAKEYNAVDVTIDGDAADWICEMSEGYPHFVQQFAYSAFDADADNTIDLKDVLRGANSQNGAFHQLGQKYFHPMYFERIMSEDYRAVLRAMSEHLDAWVTKQQVRKATALKGSVLNDAIKALKERHIIIAKPGCQGVYRLPSRSFAVWIKAYSQQPAPETGQATSVTAEKPSAGA